jgi:CheY-like chemotaxis protein
MNISHRILVVDDNPDNRDVLSRILELSGYAVISAMNGIHALDIAEQERPDLILMDLAMPEMDGWEATSNLKTRPHLAHIPVIALTGHVTSDDIRRAIHAGCQDYLAKPVDFDRLLYKVKTHLAA